MSKKISLFIMILSLLLMFVSCNNRNIEYTYDELVTDFEVEEMTFKQGVSTIYLSENNYIGGYISHEINVDSNTRLQLHQTFFIMDEIFNDFLIFMGYTIFNNIDRINDKFYVPERITQIGINYDLDVFYVIQGDDKVLTRRNTLILRLSDALENGYDDSLPSAFLMSISGLNIRDFIVPALNIYDNESEIDYLTQRLYTSSTLMFNEPHEMIVLNVGRRYFDLIYYKTYYYFESYGNLWESMFEDNNDVDVNYLDEDTIITTLSNKSIYLYKISSE